MGLENMQYRVVDGVLARSVGDAVILFHPETERILSVRGSGIRVWELLCENGELARLIARLTEEYAGPAPIIQEETRQFLAQLESEQVIRKQG